MRIRKNGVPAPILNPAQIIVRSRGGKWHIHWANSDQVFAEEAFAVRAAIELAHESGKSGSPACVVLIKRKAPTIVWTYGVDPYPPD
jgi:hypothetical protein